MHAADHPRVRKCWQGKELPRQLLALAGNEPDTNLIWSRGCAACSLRLCLPVAGWLPLVRSNKVAQAWLGGIRPGDCPDMGQESE